MTDDTAPTPNCPACDCALRPGSIFCHGCGAYLDRGLHPVVLEKMAVAIKRARKFRYLGYVLTPFVFALMFFVLKIGFMLFQDVFEQQNIVLHITFLLIALICISIYYYRTRLHSVRCPACNCRMPETVASSSLFCHKCGTRIRHVSATSVSFVGASVRLDEVTYCSICGGKVEPGDTFCAGCGGNLGRGFFTPEDDAQQSETEFFRQRQICPGCGKRLQVVSQGIDRDFGYVRQNNYCTSCGYCLSPNMRNLATPEE